MPEKFYVKDPKTIIYNQIERLLEARAVGKGAYESLWLLDAMLVSIKDKKYKEKIVVLMKKLKAGNDADDAFYSWYTYTISLLASKGLWVVSEEVW